MQKWEYLRLFWYSDKKDYCINGNKYALEKGVTIYIIMNKLGREGWELVTCPSNLVCDFKRLLE